MELELGTILSLILKPAVLLIALRLAIQFYRLHEQEPGFRQISISLLLFSLGEFACALDVYLFSKMTAVNEGLHDTGMALSFSFLILGLSNRFLNRPVCFESSCPGFSSCEIEPGRCKRFMENTRMLNWSLVGLIILTLLLYPIEPITTSGLIEAGLGDEILGSYTFFRTPGLIQLQYHIMPTFALIMLVIAGLILWSRQRISALSLLFVSFGSGTLLFAYFRLMMLHFYDPDLLWVGLAEEILELCAVIYLWLWYKPVFRAGMKKPRP